MGIFEAVKKPAIWRLLAKKLIPVYIFLLIAVIGIKHELPVYLKHKYPPVKKEKRFLGLIETEHHSKKWLVEYDKWSFYLYLLTIGLAVPWALLLLKSTLSEADGLVKESFEKAERAEKQRDLSSAIYNLKTALSFVTDPQISSDIENKIDKLKSTLGSIINPTMTIVSETPENAGETTVVKQPSIEAGIILNRYKKIRELGRGGMGVVWLAEDKVLERQVAVKELPIQFSNDTEFKNRFLREAKLLAKLTHPNIVQIYDIIEDTKGLYYTMEFVDGDSLDKASKNSKMQLKSILDYAEQILMGIEYAHGMKIIHRDLKPMNILLRPDGILKIADFGLAKILGSASFTMAGTIMGSPRYMSPEQAMGEDVDERSDIYSFSMIIYELVTGKPAFTGSTSEVMAKQIRMFPPVPSTVAKIPAWLDGFIMKGIEKDKVKRYQTAAAMLEVLNAHKSET